MVKVRIAYIFTNLLYGNRNLVSKKVQGWTRASSSQGEALFGQTGALSAEAQASTGQTQSLTDRDEVSSDQCVTSDSSG